MVEQQEENNYNYQTKGWEFKILKTNNDRFRKTTVLKQVWAEKLAAGWILLEKIKR